MKYLLVLLSILLPYNILGQNLKKVKLSKADIQSGVKWRYEFNETHSFFNKTLWLFKDGRYKFSESSFARDLKSTGIWTLYKNILMLNSDIKKDNVPISISYTYDTIGIVNRFRFGVVKNRNGEYLTDAFVNINSSSVKCLPLAGGCIGSYNTIDSVRLLFENGFTSQWIKIEQNDKYVLIKAEIDFKISDYQSFDNFKYQLNSRQLTPVEN